MTPLNTIIEEEKKEFEARFCNERICKCCLNKECNHSTTGCPWYQNDVFLHTDNAIQIKAFLTTAMQRAYEAGKADWLRSEIEKLEGVDEFIAVKDNDTHRYQIPKSKKAEWDAFCEIPEDDERSWDVPEWAERIDGMPVTSFKDSIITRYKEELVELNKPPIKASKNSCVDCGISVEPYEAQCSDCRRQV